MDNLKPCPNCGSAKITEEGYPFDPESPVFCDDCGEERTREEWQADSAREKLIQAKVDALVKLVKALDRVDSEILRELEDARLGPLCRPASLSTQQIEIMECVGKYLGECRALGLEV